MVALAGGAPAGAPQPIPPLTRAHEALRSEIRAWVASELAPHADAWEAARSFPSELFGAMAEQGYIGLKFPREYGGADDPVAAAVFAEELACCGSGGVAAGLGAHTGIALPPIASFGTEEQKARWLAPGIRGELIAALAITEPDAGSDVAGIRTRARPVDGGWVVDGAKMFITGGVRADLLVTAVVTGESGGHAGISFLVIPRGDGIDSRPIEKLGWHASDTALITFDEVFVPEENLLGELDGGFKLIMANFGWERLLMSLGAVGAMAFALERTCARIERTGERAPQSVRHRLAQCATEIESGRAIAYGALRAFLGGGADAVGIVTMAKLATQRTAVDVVDTCMDVLGVGGVLVEGGLERALRDARLGPIGGGTDEIMKEILGRTLGL